MMEVEEVQADRRTFVSCAGDAEAKKGSAAATQRVGQRVYWRWRVGRAATRVVGAEREHEVKSESYSV